MGEVVSITPERWEPLPKWEGADESRYVAGRHARLNDDPEGTARAYIEDRALLQSRMDIRAQRAATFATGLRIAGVSRNLSQAN